MTRLTTSVLVTLVTFACDRPTSPPPAATGAPPVPSYADPRPPSSSPAASSSSGPTGPEQAGRAGEQLVTFDAEALGAPSPLFEGIVGDWHVAEAGAARGLEIDGSAWRSGTASASLADQAKRLYGERYAEFLDGVKAFAFFPFAVWKGDPPEGDIRASVRFFPLAGRIDQAAGIAFGITADGTYLGVRANALEDNLLFFQVVKGRRTILDTVRSVETATKTWHTIAVELHGKTLTAELDGKKRFEKGLNAAPRGKVGLWSKADSQVLFDDFKVVALAAAP